MFKCFLALFFFACFLNGDCLPKFCIDIYFDTTIQKENLTVFCENGVSVIYPDSLPNQSNQITISGPLYARYGTVTITYRINNASYSHQFWVDSMSAYIYLSKAETGDIFKNCRKKNLIDMFELNKEVYARFKYFNRNETDQISKLFENQKSYPRNDFQKEIKRAMVNWMKNSSKFIKENASDNYFFYWFFDHQFLFRDFLAGDTALIQAYKDTLKSIFSPRILQSFECRNALRKLDSYFNLHHKINSQAPKLELADIDGNNINLQLLKNRVVLLDYWATWCYPCVQSIPFLKELRTSYPKEQLVMISIDYDTDSAKFSKYIHEHNMDWIHIYDKHSTIHLFGEFALPRTVIINQKGIIVHNKVGVNPVQIKRVLNHSILNSVEERKVKFK